MITKLDVPGKSYEHMLHISFPIFSLLKLLWFWDNNLEVQSSIPRDFNSIILCNHVSMKPIWIDFTGEKPSQF